MQLLSTLSLFLAFAVSALSLIITTPGASTRRVDLSKPFTIKWRTVPSDPEHFTITLVNTDGHNINKDVAENVSSSENEYRVESISGIPAGCVAYLPNSPSTFYKLISTVIVSENYQINFRSTERNNQGILAQSTRFNVTKVAVEDDDEDDGRPLLLTFTCPLHIPSMLCCISNKY
ncbi:GPI anchored serine-threonine rich family protein [Aspergillus stella-maris]|uniref:GPI anchored serine-threonine rich family protein n=1 Tax=Aspergillus stella-maris TaxID=1810926 RepID=UPI003CCD7307